ncbi:hypothetical protein BY998_11138 [Methylobacterium sp. B4]|nr:hypothetical protein BY998_11138 [Methylobacterium sp. B4]
MIRAAARCDGTQKLYEKYGRVTQAYCADSESRRMNRPTRWVLWTLTNITVLLTLNGAISLGVWVVVRSMTFADPFAEQAASHYLRAIPAEIELTSMIAQGSDMTLFDPLIPIRREACGGAAFQLSDEAAAQLEFRGLAHLGSARTGRGYVGGPEEPYWTYQPWQETPVPSTWIGDGKWASGFGCLKEGARHFDADAVYKAVREPGAYFTTGRESEMVIIPRLRLLVLTYLG